MTTQQGRRRQPLTARRRRGAAEAGSHALLAVGTGSTPAVGGPTTSAPLARGIFWRGTAAALLAGLTLPALPMGVAHAGLSSTLRTYVLKAEPGKLQAAVDAVVAAGGAVGETVSTTGGTIVTVEESVVSQLTSTDAVATLTPEHETTSTTTATAYDASRDPYALKRSQLHTGVSTAWSMGATGAGVRVAVIDSGISAVPGLDAAGQTTPGIDLSFDAVSEENRHRDGYGHGTHLGGIIAGDDGSAKRAVRDFTGVAPDAELVGVKVGDSQGRVDVTQVLAALDWVIATQAQTGVRVVNLSFNAGGLQSHTLDPLSFAVERAWKAGIVVVVSAGNDGDALGRLQNPAQNPYVLAVGAVDDKGTKDRADDVVPAFSAEGDGVRNPDLIAPGMSVPSLAAPNSFAAGHAKKAGDRLVRASGTSQAAAYVSGAAALLLGARPDLTPDQVKHLLTSTAHPLAGTPATRQGAGVLDVAAALSAPVPGAEAVQSFAPSTGLGSIELSRGDRVLLIDGKPLVGEVDVWGSPFDAASAGSLSGASWSGASWSGASWSGASWSGASWSGASWSGASWSGASWS